MGSTITSESKASTDQPGVGTFLESAKIEFQACLQLLAERARFLTRASRVAIALSEQDRFLYSASSGESAPEIGDSAEIEEFRRSILEGKPAFGREKGDGEAFLLVPIRRNTKTAGFFKLWGKDLDARELQAIERLQEMVATAIDHLQAAEKSGELVARAFAQRPSLEPPAANSLEHPPLRPGLNREPGAARRVHTCRSCGFPVSDRRSLCLDCEERAPNSSPGTTAAPLFATASGESWLREHLYTIASLLVTALAAIAIYWLR